jgi:hypothetical protein
MLLGWFRAKRRNRELGLGCPTGLVAVLKAVLGVLCVAMGPDPLSLTLAVQVRTALNMLGPLLNPAEAEYGVVGVYDTAISELMAGSLLVSESELVES